LVQKVIIWYKDLLFFDRVFSELLEKIITHNFFWYRGWFEAFIYLHIRDGGGGPFERIVQCT